MQSARTPPRGIEELLPGIAAAFDRADRRKLAMLLESLAKRVAAAMAADLRALILVAHYDVPAARSMWTVLLPRLR